MQQRITRQLMTVGLLAITSCASWAQIPRGKAVGHIPGEWRGRMHPTGNGTPEGRAGIAAGTTVNGMTYHGGPVILGTTNVYVIWYGNWSADRSGQNIILHELSYLGGTAYNNINASYYNGSGTRVSNAVHYNGSTTDNYSQGRNLTDAGVQAVVNRAVGAGHLPKDSHGIYFVLTTKDVTETSGFCTNYCGWHNRATILGSDLKFSFVGNAATQCPWACMEQSSRSPNSNPGADGMASVIAHELSEAITDPDLNAWYDVNGMEDADKCAWRFGTTHTASNGSLYNVTIGGWQYLLQQNWVNASGGYCALGR